MDMTQVYAGSRPALCLTVHTHTHTIVRGNGLHTFLQQRLITKSEAEDNGREQVM